MKNRIRKAMEDMLQKNCICNYTYVLNGKEVFQKSDFALDAYMTAYELSINGNVECYMTPNGKRAHKPVLSIKDGIITLSGQVI